jgi:hypothetical protein
MQNGTANTKDGERHNKSMVDPCNTTVLFSNKLPGANRAAEVLSLSDEHQVVDGQSIRDDDHLFHRFRRFFRLKFAATKLYSSMYSIYKNIHRKYIIYKCNFTVQ